MKTVISLVFIFLGCTNALDASGLTLSGSDPELVFNQPDHPFSIYLTDDTLYLSNCIEYEEGENVYLNLESITGSTSLEIDKDLSFDSINQWKLCHAEDFSSPTDWSDNSNSECSGITMLGGYCQFSNTEVSKTFIDLPAHSSLKIVATFHFIDAWIGETAYMKASLDGEHEYLWTENYKAGQASNGINLCGAHHAEGKFVSPIEVTVPHTDDFIQITFGALLDEDACDESWGVSLLEIYIR